MAAAFTAWLTAPAPIAWTSARRCSRTTPAIAPATAVERDRAETLITSTILLCSLFLLHICASFQRLNVDALSLQAGHRRVPEVYHSPTFPATIRFMRT